ncbi:hypothetical protein ACFQGT_11910 [Natrialbaceae archaeon GCM10025810]|uniref:hypothetical protein n=1 Tax=Halovalidus salilacus TaxID=3075124 RepID=UPI00360E4B44
MSIRHADADAELESHAARSRRTTTTESSRSSPVTGRAPRTFAHRDAERLRNLIDECNAAFLAPGRVGE